jgi:hypothetical protein
VELTANVVEKLVGKMTTMLSEIEAIAGSYLKDKSREGTTQFLTLLIQSYIISILERAESEHKGLSLELLSIVHVMAATDSALADRFHLMSKRQ